MMMCPEEAAASQSGAVATLTDSQLGEMANAILTAKFSRGQESEADLYSYNFLKRNKYDVMGEVSAFRKLAKLSEGTEQSKLQIDGMTLRITHHNTQLIIHQTQYSKLAVKCSWLLNA